MGKKLRSLSKFRQPFSCPSFRVPVVDEWGEKKPTLSGWEAFLYDARKMNVLGFLGRVRENFSTVADLLTAIGRLADEWGTHFDFLAGSGTSLRLVFCGITSIKKLLLSYGIQNRMGLGKGWLGAIPTSFGLLERLPFRSSRNLLNFLGKKCL